MTEISVSEGPGGGKKGWQVANKKAMVKDSEDWTVRLGDYRVTQTKSRRGGAVQPLRDKCQTPPCHIRKSRPHKGNNISLHDRKEKTECLRFFILLQTNNHSKTSSKHQLFFLFLFNIILFFLNLFVLFSLFGF